MSGKILLVDDEEGLRMTLAANLELEGFEVVEACDGRHALELLETQSFDLVLSDVRMPRMTGVDLFVQIREKDDDLPVVLMTAFTDELELERAYQAGVFAILPKPFSVERAIQTVGRALPRPFVLLVDDLKTDAEETGETLREVGLRVLTADSSKAAMERLAAGGVDVVVTDLKMPEVDGAELTRMVHEKHPSVSVIVFSGHDVPHLMRRAASSGAFACLRKPMDPAGLITAIARARATT